MPADVKTKKTNGVLWEVTRTTTGMVATCAIFAIFLVSPDKQLSAKGDTTKFEYAMMWKHYREMLDRNEDGVYDELFNLFDDFIFNDGSNQDTQPSGGDMKIQSVKETMRQMKLGILNPDFVPENNSESSEYEHASAGPAPSADEEADIHPLVEISDNEDGPITSSSSSTQARGCGCGRGHGRGRGAVVNVVADPKPNRTTRSSGRKT
ncbi:hypothetical protein C8Q75DRAFT_738015 [Abortiporus biennis]|nr:hypothetical protein C8Q75DRAFT_738015 [Abortiporus biennis]